MLSLEVDMKFKRSREKRKQPEELQRRRLDRGSVEYRRRSLIIFKLHRLFCLRESLPFFFFLLLVDVRSPSPCTPPSGVCLEGE